MTHFETKSFLTINLEDNMQFRLHESMPNYFNPICYIGCMANLLLNSFEKKIVCNCLLKLDNKIQTKFSRENRLMIISHQCPNVTSKG